MAGEAPGGDGHGLVIFPDDEANPPTRGLIGVQNQRLIDKEAHVVRLPRNPVPVPGGHVEIEQRFVDANGRGHADAGGG